MTFSFFTKCLAKWKQTQTIDLISLKICPTAPRKLIEKIKKIIVFHSPEAA
jgi:hypothetical protein